MTKLEKSLEDSKKVTHSPINIDERWISLKSKHYITNTITGLPKSFLTKLGKQITTLPEMNVNNVIQKIYDARKTSIVEGKGIDWATAESLAFASLISEGKKIRVSGQDVERGTFSHRHAVVHDQLKNYKYCPINSISDKNQFQIGNSHLSEFAVLGFEVGYSYYDPDHLVIWEAQFGDFSNEAQTIIDQFLSSQEQKWGVQSGIVLLLPHGMEGQGAEHSSCRIERFLQMLDDNPLDLPNFGIINDRNSMINMQVANPTTSANYFHLLRRQLRRQYRKPLIVPSPKKLLKFKQAGSTIEEFEREEFLKVRPDENKDVIKNADKVKRILACSGPVYYDLIKRREDEKRNVSIFN